MLLQPPRGESRSQITLEVRCLGQFGVHGSFGSYTDAGETEIGFVAKVPVIDSATRAQNCFSEERAVSLQHRADFVEGQLAPILSVLQTVELRIFIEARSLRLHHIHVGVGAHDFRIDGDIEFSRNLAQTDGLVEGVNIGIFRFHTIHKVVGGDVALGGNADIHLRGAEVEVNLLQLLRCGGGAIANIEGIALFKLVQGEGTQRQRHTEFAGVFRRGSIVPAFLFFCKLQSGISLMAARKPKGDGLRFLGRRHNTHGLTFHAVNDGVTGVFQGIVDIL